MFSLFCNSHLLKGHQAIFRKICLSHLTFNFKEVELRQDFADKRNKLDSHEKISFKKKVRLQFEYALIALCYSFTYFFQSSVALCLVVVFYLRNTKKSVFINFGPPGLFRVSAVRCRYDGSPDLQTSPEILVVYTRARAAHFKLGHEEVMMKYLF